MTEPEKPPAATGTDDPAELLKVGIRMNDRLIEAITAGYSHGEDEETMILTVYNELCNEPLRKTAAHALAGIFAQAQARKWDLVMENVNGTRVVIHCDTEEEQERKALKIMTTEKLDDDAVT